MLKIRTAIVAGIYFNPYEYVGIAIAPSSHLINSISLSSFGMSNTFNLRYNIESAKLDF